MDNEMKNFESGFSSLGSKAVGSKKCKYINTEGHNMPDAMGLKDEELIEKVGRSVFNRFNKGEQNMAKVIADVCEESGDDSISMFGFICYIVGCARGQGSSMVPKIPKELRDSVKKMIEEMEQQDKD